LTVAAVNAQSQTVFLNGEGSGVVTLQECDSTPCSLTLDADDLAAYDSPSAQVLTNGTPPFTFTCFEGDTPHVAFGTATRLGRCIYDGGTTTVPYLAHAPRPVLGTTHTMTVTFSS
jgi:hypothetical protein